MRLFAILILTAAVPAYACPNLAGNYVCQSTRSKQDFSRTVTQTDVGGVTKYSLDEMDFISDNQDHPLPAKDSIKSASVRSSCNNNQLKVDIKGQFSYGAELGTIYLHYTFSAVGEELHETKDMTLDAGEASGEYHDNIICKHVK